MPITTLDSQVALIVIDLQNNSLAGVRAPNPMAQVVSNSSALAASFRRHGLPVVLVKVMGRPPGRMEFVRSTPRAPDTEGSRDLLPELDQQPQDLVLEKRTWSAFLNTGLEQYLRQRKVTQVVITGCATSIGVEATARDAYGVSFNVTIATDAVTDGTVEAHLHSLTRIFPRLGETGATQEILELLETSRA